MKKAFTLGDDARKGINKNRSVIYTTFLKLTGMVNNFFLEKIITRLF